MERLEKRLVQDFLLNCFCQRKVKESIMREVTKEQFINDYNTMTYDMLCEKYKISRNTISKFAKILNLKKKVGRKMNLRIID